MPEAAPRPDDGRFEVDIEGRFYSWAAPSIATAQIVGLAGWPVGLAVAAGLFGSNGEARRTISQGGLSINEIRIGSADDPLPAPLAGGYLVLRSGKKAYRIVRIGAG